MVNAKKVGRSRRNRGNLFYHLLELFFMVCDYIIGRINNIVNAASKVHDSCSVQCKMFKIYFTITAHRNNNIHNRLQDAYE